MLLGPGDINSTARGLEVGARFDGPLDVSALGVLLAWPLAAVITYFAVSAGSEAGDPLAGRDDGSSSDGSSADGGSADGVSPTGGWQQSEPR